MLKNFGTTVHCLKVCLVFCIDAIGIQDGATVILCGIGQIKLSNFSANCNSNNDTTGLLTTVFKHGDNSVFTNLWCLLQSNDSVFVNLHSFSCFRTTVFKHGDNSLFTNLRCLLLLDDSVFVKIQCFYYLRFAGDGICNYITTDI